MTAGLDTLDDQRVSTRIGRRSRRLPERPVPALAAPPARARATSSGRSAKENDTIGARSSRATRAASFLLKIEHEIYAERPIRCPPD